MRNKHKKKVQSAQSPKTRKTHTPIMTARLESEADESVREKETKQRHTPPAEDLLGM